MNFSGKTMMFGLAIAMAGVGAVNAVPAEARTQVYVGIGDGDGYYGGGYRNAQWGGDRGYRDGYRGNGWRDGGYRGRDGHDWNRHYGDRRGWRGDNGWRGNGNWGHRERCWTEWRYNRFDGRVPVRICR